MRLFRKFPLLLLGLALSASAVAGKKDETPADKKTEKSGKGGKGEKPAPGAEAEAAPDPKSGRISLPLVEGHDSIGLKIPYYDEAGRLQMNYTIGLATKLDPDHVKMSDTKVETFNEEGEEEMSIDLPVSVFDLSTRVITSQTKTTIKRDDFTITGDSLAFDTVSKQGSLIGNVHMTIYNVKAEMEPTPAPASAEPAAPATADLSQDKPQ